MNHEPTSSKSQDQNLIAEASGDVSSAAVWPEQQLDILAGSIAALGGIPGDFGGVSASSTDLLSAFMELSRHCLTTAFVLSQRNAAIQRITSSENRELKANLLPELAANELFATVGISHLTTSRRHLPEPPVRVERVDAGFILDGEVPWVTGADKADVIVTGGVLPQGKQVLLALHTNTAGVSVSEPLPLLALNGSRTAAINLHQVYVPLQHLLFGPVDNVMKDAGVSAGSLLTTALVIGHSQNALAHLLVEVGRRPELAEVANAFQSELRQLEGDVFDAAANIDTRADENQETSTATDGNLTCGPMSAEQLRERANSLVLRVTQALLAVSKGAGFLRGHPAARLMNEALFFLVWSCPQTVMLAGLSDLTRPAAAGSPSN